jgi:hypothetical protein
MALVTGMPRQKLSVQVELERQWSQSTTTKSVKKHLCSLDKPRNAVRPTLINAHCLDAMELDTERETLHDTGLLAHAQTQLLTISSSTLVMHYKLK